MNLPAPSEGLLLKVIYVCVCVWPNMFFFFFYVLFRKTHSGELKSVICFGICFFFLLLFKCSVGALPGSILLPGRAPTLGVKVMWQMMSRAEREQREKDCVGGVIKDGLVIAVLVLAVFVFRWLVFPWEELFHSASMLDTALKSGDIFYAFLCHKNA